jgi:hypothetical protein
MRVSAISAVGQGELTAVQPPHLGGLARDVQLALELLALRAVH